MTLVLTDVSRFGVAMAADSAVTFDNDRVFVGFQKLLPVPCVNAGLSLWGKGSVNGMDADIWLQRFIESEVSSRMHLWDVACKLAEKLNGAFGRVISERMGIHVGGFDERNGIRGPAFYHVHNGHYEVGFRNGEIVTMPREDPPIREFEAHPDCPPGKKYGMTRNGDFAIFAFLFDTISPLLDNLQQMTVLTFPYPPSLAARGEYLRFWINIVIEIYRLSNARRRILPQPATAGDASIGGPVTVLTISESGIESFYTK